MGWTKEQQKAIDLRGCNLLVSAAAGSGKTAVLVERIVKMVCEEDYDIDKILVVTFTKAAAAEMKERIGKRLLDEGMNHPDNHKIQEQLSYIHRAPISTIHSFCSSLLRNHFHLISLDPGFRIGEEGEVALIREQVLSELLEEKYAQRDEEFLRFVEAYSYGKDDRNIGEMIKELFRFSISHPIPEQWLMEAVEALGYTDGEKACNSVEKGVQSWEEWDNGSHMPNESLKEPVWLTPVKEYADRILIDAIGSYDRALEISLGDIKLSEKYIPAFEKEKKQIQAILEAESYDQRVEAFSQCVFPTAPRVVSKDPLVVEQRELAKSFRDNGKDMVTGLKSDCYTMSLSGLNQEAAGLKPYLSTLVNLIIDFSDKFFAAKQEKNILEFHDLEHLALKLLIEGYKDGEVVKTPLARELSRRYQAIFTDEYQDSNLIQEVLLKAVAREEDGNRFMVGDIKQSIYRFRMARPEIFLEKYALGAGRGQEGLYRNVELRNNFRSRPEVLYSINYIFYQIMKPSLGDVLYEKKVALMPPEDKRKTFETLMEKECHNGEDSGEQGSEVEETWKQWNQEEIAAENPDGSLIPQELLLLDMEKESGDFVTDDYSVIELEARMVANRIKEMKEYEYKDMVILLRTMEGWAGIFEEVLTLAGIPVHTESRKGYFDTFEIRILLNMLSVIDNVYQDIPMAAVLRSPIGGFTGEDLAKIRSLVVADRRGEDNLYDEMIYYLEQGTDGELKGKVDRIIKLLHILREEKTRLSLPELIWSLMERTDYYHFVGSMPNGEQRMANIRMFLEKAGEYEKTSFKGVFHFIQYMEQIRSYDIDYGEASVLGEEANLVRIMSIHKSKGLEFPVVFLSGTGKMFNFMDRNKRMLLHPDFYVGLDCIDLKNRVKYPSRQKKMISRQQVLGTVGEELRVLYVAMTRARDKLIMTGKIDDFEKSLREFGGRPSQEQTFYKMTKTSSYLQWILPAILRSHSMDSFRKAYNITMNEKDYFQVEGETPLFHVRVTKAIDLLGKEMADQCENYLSKAQFCCFLNEEPDQGEISKIQEAFAWEYPGKKELKARSKWSVSQLKEESLEEPLLVSVSEADIDPGMAEILGNADRKGKSICEGEERLCTDTESKPIEEKRTIPEFLKEKVDAPLTGASRGTAVHKLMEELSFVKVEEIGLESAIENLVEEGKFPESYVASIPIRQMEWFFGSHTGKRILRAEKENNLYKEAQFMIGVPMKEMEADTDSEELVLVQGVIDLYLEEKDGLVLLDYKTDYIEKGQEQILIDRYNPQLLWYKRALEQMTGKKVKETLIYSFGLSKTLVVDKL